MTFAPQMVITPAQRLYYNYRIHGPSADAERASGGGPQRPRDFRSQREREHDPTAV